MKTKSYFFNAVVAVVIALTGMMVISACSASDVSSFSEGYTEGYNAVRGY